MLEHDLAIQADSGSGANHFSLYDAVSRFFGPSKAIGNKGGHFTELLKELDEGVLNRVASREPDSEQVRN